MPRRLDNGESSSPDLAGQDLMALLAQLGIPGDKGNPLHSMAMAANKGLTGMLQKRALPTYDDLSYDQLVNMRSTI